MLNFQIISNTLPKKDYRLLFEEIKKLGRDFNFYAELRAGQLKSFEYKLMLEAGFINVQVVENKKVKLKIFLCVRLMNVLLVRDMSFVMTVQIFHAKCFSL